MVRIPDLLRAAAVLDRATAQRIAIRTGIRRSRVERLLTGRTPPRGDEPARILAACGADPALTTVPRHGSGVGGLPARTALGLLLNRVQHPHRPIDLGSCNLCIDTLCLSFDAPTGRLLAIARDAGRRVRASPESKYRYAYRCTARIFVQHGPQGRSKYKHTRNSRLVFNSAHLTDDGWKLVRRVLDLAVRVRVTRIDVAVDLPASIRRFQVLGAPKHKPNTFIGLAGVETIYVAPESRRVRLYDKRQQLIDAGLVDESHPELTRVEAQLTNLGGTIDDLVDLRDPFADLRLVEIAAGDGLPFLHALAASYASTFGAVALRPLVPPSDFDAIARQVPPMEAPHPSLVFADQYPRVVADLLRQLAAKIAGGTR